MKSRSESWISITSPSHATTSLVISVSFKNRMKSSSNDSIYLETELKILDSFWVSFKYNAEETAFPILGIENHQRSIAACLWIVAKGHLLNSTGIMQKNSSKGSTDTASLTTKTFEHSLLTYLETDMYKNNRKWWILIGSRWKCPCPWNCNWSWTRMFYFYLFRKWYWLEVLGSQPGV